MLDAVESDTKATHDDDQSTSAGCSDSEAESNYRNEDSNPSSTCSSDSDDELKGADDVVRPLAKPLLSYKVGGMEGITKGTVAVSCWERFVRSIAKSFCSRRSPQSARQYDRSMLLQFRLPVEPHRKSAQLLPRAMLPNRVIVSTPALQPKPKCTKAKLPKPTPSASCTVATPPGLAFPKDIPNVSDLSRQASAEATAYDATTSVPAFQPRAKLPKPTPSGGCIVAAPPGLTSPKDLPDATYLSLQAPAEARPFDDTISTPTLQPKPNLTQAKLPKPALSGGGFVAAPPGLASPKDLPDVPDLSQQASAEAKAFDAIAFRKELVGIFRELASSRNVSLAVRRVRDQSVPKSDQAQQFVDILTRAAEEKRAVVRRTNLAFVVGLAKAQHSAFEKSECIAGLRLFFQDVYGELCAELPRFKVTMTREFLPSLYEAIPIWELGNLLPADLKAR